MTTSRREPSLRAQAREHYKEAAARTDSTSTSESANTPLPNPPPQGGREQTGLAARVAPELRAPHSECATADASPSLSLTERVRALYEDSVVPVREIARLAGVTERTIYKYAHKERWTPRVTWLARDGTAAELPARGVAGRFIRREDVGKSYPRGLKALDPDGATQAAAACVRAGKLSHDAVAQAHAKAQSRAARVRSARDVAAYLRTLELLTGSLVELAKWRAELRADLRFGLGGRASARAERHATHLEHAILNQLDPDQFGRMSRPPPAVRSG